MPTTVGLEDEGAFMLASFFNGIAHPPGYPLYTYLGYIFSQVEISTVAARLHFLSAIFGVLACFLVSRVTKLLTGSNFLGFVSALSLGVSEIFWMQSITAEVYTLNAAIFFSVFLLLLVFMKRAKEPESREGYFGKPSIPLFIAAFVFGLGLSNHWPLLVLSSPAFFFLVVSQWRYVIIRLPLIVVFLALGLTPYLWMFFKGLESSAWITFGGWSSFREFLFYIMREGYSTVDNSQTAGWGDKFKFILFSGSETARQFGFVGFSVSLIGVYILAFKYKERLITLSLLTAFLGCTVVLSLLLGFDFEGYRQIIFSVYLLVPFGIVSIFTCVAISKFLAIVTSYRLRAALAALVLLYPCTTLAKNFTNLYRSNDTWGNDYAAWVLNTIPKNAILFVNDDTDTGPIGYLHYIEHMREDIEVYHSIGALYPNRLFHPYRVSKTHQRIKTTEFIESSEKPVFSTSKLPISMGMTSLGAIQKYGAEGDDQFVPYYIEKNYELVRLLLNNRAKTGWQKVHREFLSRLILSALLESVSLEDVPEDILATLLTAFDGKLYFLNWLINQENVDVVMVSNLIQDMEKNKGTAFSKVSLSEFYFESARFYLETGRKELGVQYLIQSVDIVPTFNNRSSQLLYEIYTSDKNPEKVEELQQKINYESQNVIQ